MSGATFELPARIGVGLKSEHFADVLACRPDLGFFEVHAENYMVDGGPFHHYLGRIRERHALSMHGVGLSIGGEAPLDEDHLDRLAQLAQRYEPASFSEHLAWSSHGGAFLNDLLPLPYDAATLDRVCRHVERLQERLGRRILLENPATYVEFEASTMSEAEFLGAVVRRSGCGLLLDVNNAHVSCTNHGRDAWHYIDALPLHAVGEVHLAGFARDIDAAGAPLLIDSHGSPVDAAVWALYERLIERLGPLPTLLERDHDVPALDVLITEARRAEVVMAGARSAPRQAAPQEAA
ncbi:MAG: DUF692 domain-containing protein [Burkholderiales bacterium]|nr:DUF692 domain-containing protein [Burkholderiales bacterium]MDE1926156.1 DUF692 domain-containing protein [Burkholderiales bacterium]MDE2158043.1 DUF692 domain-containing protein [Burkholderiales bacterium]MDE2501832.1 DUF692 domain-containing protein [Burkholderiales bacterium]